MPVDHRLCGIGHGRNDETARTHAERVDAAAILLAHERVGGRRKVFTTRLLVILNRVDQRLRMFDTHTHRKGLGLDTHTPAVEQFINIARRMARRQHNGGAFDEFVAAPDPTNTVIGDFQVRHTAPETKYTARPDNRLPDMLHDARQFVGSDMGMRFEENFRRSAVKYQRLQRFVVVAAFLAAREKFAVGERSRPRLHRRRNSNRGPQLRCD